LLRRRGGRSGGDSHGLLNCLAEWTAQVMKEKFALIAHGSWVALRERERRRGDSGKCSEELRLARNCGAGS
jgi:hypothetical protein